MEKNRAIKEREREERREMNEKKRNE